MMYGLGMKVSPEDSCVQGFALCPEALLRWGRPWSDELTLDGRTESTVDELMAE